MPKVKFKLRPESRVPLVSAILALLSAVILTLVYGPIFSHYLGSPASARIPHEGAVAFYCALLVALTLLYCLLTGFLAKKALALSAIAALPVTLMYILDITGIRNTILFFEYDTVLRFYRESEALFRGWWPLVVAVAVVLLFCALSFLKVALQRAAGKAYSLLFSMGALALWCVYAILHLIYREFPYLYNAVDGFGARDLVISIAYYGAGMLYFLSLCILQAAVRKTLVGGETSPAEPEKAPLDVTFVPDPVMNENGRPFAEEKPYIDIYTAESEPVVEASFEPVVEETPAPSSQPELPQSAEPRSEKDSADTEAEPTAD